MTSRHLEAWIVFLENIKGLSLYRSRCPTKSLQCDRKVVQSGSLEACIVEGITRLGCSPSGWFNLQNTEEMGLDIVSSHVMHHACWAQPKILPLFSILFCSFSSSFYFQEQQEERGQHEKSRHHHKHPTHCLRQLSQLASWRGQPPTLKKLENPHETTKPSHCTHEIRVTLRRV